METALGVSILLVVALASATHHPGKALSTPSAPLTGASIWNAQALPIVASLVDDVRAVDSHTSQPTQAEPTWLGTDDARLRADVDAARRLQPPTDPSMRTDWSAALSRLSRAERTLGAAAANLDPATVALAHQQFAVAGDVLLRIGRSIAPPVPPGPAVTDR